MKAYYRRNREAFLLRIKQYYQIPKNREKRKKYRKKYWQKYYKNSDNRRGHIERNKGRVLKFVLNNGGKCELCGFCGIWALQIHHKEGKKYKLDFLAKNFDKTKIIVLCANCHCKQHYRKN